MNLTYLKMEGGLKKVLLLKTFLVLSFTSLLTACTDKDKLLLKEEKNENFSNKLNTKSLADTTVSITADFSINEGLFKHGMGRNLSSVSGQYNYDQPTTDKINALGLERARVWIRFKNICNINTKNIDYTYSNGYINKWSGFANRILLNWTTNYNEFMTSGNWTEAELLAAQTAALTQYKTQFPKLEYIECENELTENDPQFTYYYSLYKFINKMVNAVNALNLPGPQLKIGGPTTSAPSQWYIKKFLDHYKKDTSANKKLDFIAYHQYLFGAKDYPASVATERATVDSWLAEVGLPTLPVYITETGIFAVDETSSLGFNADLHVQAAGIMAMHYFYINQRWMYPFHWTVNHPSNDIKDLFVNTTGGIPRPFYNAIKMMTMLPSTRFSSTTALTNKGLGVGSLAGGTANKVAVLTWNYQWENGVDYSVNMLLKNLPAAFKTNNVRVERYVLDNNYHSGELLKVEDTVYPAFTSGAYSNTFLHNANALRLIVLTAQ